MQKKQKIAKKKKSQKAYKDFIHIVKWFKDDFILASYISNIYNDKKEVEVYRLPIWRDVTDIQRLAYFFYFMAETKEFTYLKPFTLDFSKEFRDRYKNLSYKELKAVIIKRMYGNLDYQLQSISKPMMSFILENKPTHRRKDINDKDINENIVKYKVKKNLKIIIRELKKAHKTR